MWTYYTKIDGRWVQRVDRDKVVLTLARHMDEESGRVTSGIYWASSSEDSDAYKGYKGPIRYVEDSSFSKRDKQRRRYIKGEDDE